MERIQVIESAIKSLAIACGFTEPISESDTEAFADSLTSAAMASTHQAMESRLDEGLCLNVFPVLARKLKEEFAELLAAQEGKQ